VINGQCSCLLRCESCDCFVEAFHVPANAHESFAEFFNHTSSIAISLFKKP
jgi:hypothetical protein